MIQSKSNSKEYENNYEMTFGDVKKLEVQWCDVGDCLEPAKHFKYGENPRQRCEKHKTDKVEPIWVVPETNINEQEIR